MAEEGQDRSFVWVVGWAAEIIMCIFQKRLQEENQGRAEGSKTFLGEISAGGPPAASTLWLGGARGLGWGAAGTKTAGETGGVGWGAWKRGGIYKGLENVA